MVPTTSPTVRRRRAPRVVVAAAVGAVLLAGCTGPLAASGPEADATAEPEPVVEVVVSGLADGALLAEADLDGLAVEVSGSDGSVPAVLLGGQPVPVDLDADRVVLTGDDLAALGDGDHVLAVALEDGTSDEVRFTIDTTAPVLAIPDVVEGTGLRAPLSVAIDAGDAVTVTADGAQVQRHDDGTATATWPRPPSVVQVTATDAAGNTSRAEAPVTVPFPHGRAVHVTPLAWTYGPKREPIIEMLEQGLIDAVQLDIKDEAGDIAWDTDVELAGLNGAEDVNRNFDIRGAIETIHSYGARVIGRLTVYRDTRLAEWAWNNDRRDWVVQTPQGTPYGGSYGDFAFTNFAHPEVQQYNLDIALEAADVGFDDVLYDYIRRPDGAMSGLVVPGLGDRTPEEAVVEVMAEAYPLLRERGVWVGASVFGIAIDRPTQIAQDIPAMAPHLDYVAPMLYPNHWNKGEHGVADPNAQPYDIIERSLALFHEELEPTGTALMPWLQDFGGYDEAEVRAQIDATEAVTGERSFLLWSSGAVYTEDALDPIPGRPTSLPLPEPSETGEG